MTLYHGVFAKAYTEDPGEWRSPMDSEALIENKKKGGKKSPGGKKSKKDKK